MKRLLKFIILLPVAVIGLAFAVANRHNVSVSFDPFSGDMEGAKIVAPLFVILILATMFGVVIGGIATWIAQGRNRRALREARSEAARWRGQAETALSAPQFPQAKYSPVQRGPAATVPTKLLAHP